VAFPVAALCVLSIWDTTATNANDAIRILTKPRVNLKKVLLKRSFIRYLQHTKGLREYKYGMGLAWCYGVYFVGMEYNYHDVVNVIITLLIISSILFPVLRAFVPPRPPDGTPGRPIATGRSGRYDVFDIVRGIAIFAVVLIHVRYLFPVELYADMDHDVLNAFNAILRFALPIFFIASGILLTPPALRLVPILTFYSRQLVRIGLPYAFALALLLFARGEFDVAYFLRSFFTGEASVPYYFIAVLLQLYLVYPFIAHLATKRAWVYVALGVSLASLLYPPWWNIAGVASSVPFLFFFMWGIYMKQQLLEGTVSRSYTPWLVLIALFLVGYVAFPGPYYNMQIFYGTAMFMVMYLALTRIPLSGYAARFFAYAGYLSLWIYLVHFPLQEFLLPYVFDATSSGRVALLLASAVSIPASVAAAYFFSTLYRFSVQQAFLAGARLVSKKSDEDK
jgi:peptidoglycan/LPS O-acetylase OafA/YrhL